MERSLKISIGGRRMLWLVAQLCDIGSWRSFQRLLNHPLYLKREEWTIEKEGKEEKYIAFPLKDDLIDFGFLKECVIPFSIKIISRIKKEAPVYGYCVVCFKVVDGQLELIKETEERSNEKGHFFEVTDLGEKSICIFIHVKGDLEIYRLSLDKELVFRRQQIRRRKKINFESAEKIKEVLRQEDYSETITGLAEYIYVAYQFLERFNIQKIDKQEFFSSFLVVGHNRKKRYPRKSKAGTKTSVNVGREVK